MNNVIILNAYLKLFFSFRLHFYEVFLKKSREACW